MHISELELVGFKSFRDKTKLRFSPRLNAVIGPNGCGKTNILDALRWVLGEQSSTILRCEKNEDLIFGGTAKIAPTNMAEVRLVLANDSLPEYPSEIEIRRRYFRTGESEYFLNRQPCRMKDITEVFLASGIGTRAYSIFDLRQMREIIAGNVRKMFEEAATLAKYREAKADCQRKLDLTERDLVRLDDIIAERERVVRSLQRQSGRLRAWEKLRTEERDLRLLELKSEYDAANRETELVSRDVETLENADTERLNDVRRLEAELARQREQLRELQGRKDAVAVELNHRRKHLTELGNRELIVSQRMTFLEEDAVRADKEREELTRSLAELEAAFNQAVQKLEQANSRQQELQEELDQARQETARAEQKLHEMRTHGQSVRESFQSLIENRHTVGSRVDYLAAVDRNQAENEERLRRETEETRKRLAGLRAEQEELTRTSNEAAEKLQQARHQVAETDSALNRIASERKDIHRVLLTARDRRARIEKELAVLRSAMPDLVGAVRTRLGERVKGEIGSYIDIDQGWERACEAALQPFLQALVVTDALTDGELNWLAESGPEAGCGLVRESDSDSEEGGNRNAKAGSPLPTADTRVSLEPLRVHVRPRPGCPAAVARILDSAVIAPDDADLEELAGKLPGSLLVNRRGYARLGDGSYMVAGPARGRLRLERQLADTTTELSSAEEELTKLTTRETDLEREAVELDRRNEDARAVFAEAERKRSALELRSGTVGARQAEIERDLERLRGELNQVINNRREDEQGLKTSREQLAELDSRVESQTAVQRRVEEETGAQEQSARERLARTSERLASLSEGRQQVSRLESERDFLRRSIEERRRQIAGLEQRAVQVREEADRLAAERQADAPAIAAAREEIAGLEARIGELSITDLVRSEEELENNLAELRSARDKHQALLLDQRMRRHELVQKRAAIIEEAATEYGTDITNFEPTVEENVADRLAEVRRRIEALGQVNPMALEEYEQERQDLEKLDAQRTDVNSARDNLNASMSEIDRHAQERFIETYARVREHFRDVFRQMFLAGEADIALSDEQNPLESEIVITARPRGKNPKRLEQLSDGEKALLAVSLLFAFYRVKPAPFCFMDEIDAPLDDANVGRFADYLKIMADGPPMKTGDSPVEPTQVIIITHNRLTVERADSLFGVTAEQPGVSKLVSVNLADYRDSEVGASVS